MSKVTARRAEQRDLENLRAHQPRPDIDLAGQRFQEMQNGTGIFAVAEYDGQIVGSGFLDFIDEALQPEVKNLWIYPEHRRLGAAHTLWTWLEEQAREAGHDEVFLSVAPDNAKAISLFLQLGYAPTGDHLMIENPSTHVVADPDQVSEHYAIYKKSLRAY
ncbi:MULTISPECIES: GNAT family N-acetyltransferase [unclassified Luteococcus]|uniref:GNAT family N-acetyltransferase n=1 Tax=unclassified Luteococcus TaxID=2639923 RepID=UPI00313B8478